MKYIVHDPHFRAWQICCQCRCDRRRQRENTCLDAGPRKQVALYTDETHQVDGRSSTIYDVQMKVCYFATCTHIRQHHQKNPCLIYCHDCVQYLCKTLGVETIWVWPVRAVMMHGVDAQHHLRVRRNRVLPKLTTKKCEVRAIP